MKKSLITSILPNPLKILSSGGNHNTTTSSLEEEGPPIPLSEDFQYEKGVCALEYWAPIKLLGEGSISDIHLVRRRSKRIHVRYKKKRDIMKFAKDNASKQEPQRNENSNEAADADETNLFVLKSIMKDHINNDLVLKEMREEVLTMSQLEHANIVKLYEAYERRRHVYLVMDYCSGGDLTDRKFTEDQCAPILRKILSAVHYMHTQKNIVHRDLKLENIMMDAHGEIKIIDFGLATKYLSDEYKEVMTDRVGTLYTMAPQVLQGVYTSQCDLWSIGVIAYMLLSQGNNLFWGPPRTMPWPKRRKIMIDLIMRCQYQRMTGPSWKSISPEAKEFVVKLLQMDPDDRPTAQQTLESKWLSLDNNNNPSPEEVVLQTKEELLARQRFLHIKRVAIQVLAEKLTDDQDVIELRSEFEKYDSSGSSSICWADFRNVLENHLSSEDFITIFGQANEDDNTMLSVEYNDFIIKLLDDKSRSTSEKAAEVLDGLDVDQSRKVPKAQLQAALQDIVPEHALNLICHDVKEDADGKVSTVEILEKLGKLLALSVRDSVHSGTTDSMRIMDKNDTDDQESALIDVADAVIPGGRHSDHAKYIYDKKVSGYVTYSH